MVYSRSVATVDSSSLGSRVGLALLDYPSHQTVAGRTCDIAVSPQGSAPLLLRLARLSSPPGLPSTPPSRGGGLLGCLTAAGSTAFPSTHLCHPLHGPFMFLHVAALSVRLKQIFLRIIGMFKASGNWPSQYYGTLRQTGVNYGSPFCEVHGGTTTPIHSRIT